MKFLLDLIIFDHIFTKTHLFFVTAQIKSELRVFPNKALKQTLGRCQSLHKSTIPLEQLTVVLAHL